MRSTIQLLLLAIIGLISYNYFYGNAKEKAQAQRVFGEVNDVFISVKDLVLLEKEKFDAGKYDKAIHQINAVFKDVRENSQDISADLKERFAKLEEEKSHLEQQIDLQKSDDALTLSEKEKTVEDFRKLIEKTETLFQDME